MVIYVVMSARKNILAALFAAFVTTAWAVEWTHIGEEDWLGGARLKSPASLTGKVVLVDVWGLRCPPCRALLPRLEQIWESFRDKPFVLLGSHRQERDEEGVKALIKANGITYPVYQGAGLVAGEPSSGGAIPFLFVLNHRGKVVYRGHSLPDATEALVTALGKVGALPGLTEGVMLANYKHLEKTLVLGKKIQAAVKQLERDAAGVNASKAVEAKNILAAIDHALAETKAEIDFQKDADPKEAVRLIKLMKETWPEEAAAYKDGFGALVAAARKQVGAERQAAAKSTPRTRQKAK